MSASPDSTGASSFGSSAGMCWPSPSSRTATSYPCSSAYLKPVWTAPPIPRLNGSRTTAAPRCGRDRGGRVGRAVVDDDDVQPRVERAQLVEDAADRPRLVPRGDDRDPAVLSHARAAGTPSSSSSSTLPRAVRVGVLVEDALARAARPCPRPGPDRRAARGTQRPPRRRSRPRAAPSRARTSARSPRAGWRRSPHPRSPARTGGTWTKMAPLRASGG